MSSHSSSKHVSRSLSPEETPDIIPPRELTAEEADQDYQKQLALLAEQNADRSAQEACHSSTTEETPDIMPSRVLSPEEADADYKKQLALLDEQNGRRNEADAASKEEQKSRL